ncbi:MAG: hypothetical protein H0X03_03330 [Nitrosopumilus sp.]|nr:hypothetical protein [Nitrosopumilus sp.]
MIEIIPAIVNLVPISLRPSVNECTIKSIIINDAPAIRTIIPIVKNTLNNGNSLFVDISFHHNY